jgi:hypothetical protein
MMLKFEIVFIYGNAAVSIINFEAPDDDHMGRNM